MTLILRAAGLFDGVAFRGPSLVEALDGRITNVRPAHPHDMAADNVLDLGPDSFLMPGMIDVHTHLGFDAGLDPIGRLIRQDDPALLEQMRVAARTALRAGITTVRDLGDRGYLALELAREFAAAPERGPEILAAGPPITTSGGHCHFLGGAAEGAEQLRAAVRERHDRGCSVVKIMVSGGHVTRGSSPYVSQYSVADLEVVVREAHGLGLPVAAHAHASQAIADAIRAGVDSLEHATFMTPDGPSAPDALLREIAASRAFVDPTVGTAPNGNPDEIAGFASVFEPLVVPYRRLHELGAHIVSGSDAGVSDAKPHDVLTYAVEHAVRFGLTPAQALASVTGLAATACGIDDRKGFIRPGQDADLLVVGGDPAANLAALRAVRAVFRAGRRVVFERDQPPAQEEVVPNEQGERGDAPPPGAAPASHRPPTALPHLGRRT